MIMVTTDSTGPDELVFINPRHVVSVVAVDDGTVIKLVTGDVIRSLDDRDDLIAEIEGAL